MYTTDEIIKIIDMLIVINLEEYKYSQSIGTLNKITKLKRQKEVILKNDNN